jgi:hypothetical protein
MRRFLQPIVKAAVHEAIHEAGEQAKREAEERLRPLVDRLRDEQTTPKAPRKEDLGDVSS